MKKFLVCMGVGLLVVAAFAMAAVAAAPKLAGNWQGTSKVVLPADGSVQTFQITDLEIYTTTDPTLFYGTLTGPEGDPEVMTIMMDAGANMHFTTSNSDDIEHITHTTGRGTASAKKIVGHYGNMFGDSGTFTAVKQ